MTEVKIFPRIIGKYGKVFYSENGNHRIDLYLWIKK